MTAPVQAIKCPNCGGSLNSTIKSNGTKCPYCSSLLVSEATRDFCECGRQFDAVCCACGTRVCDGHSICIQQFNLQKIIKSFAPHRLPMAGVLIQSLRTTVDFSAVHCSTCADAILERWLLTLR